MKLLQKTESSWATETQAGVVWRTWAQRDAHY
jgi:hypothetical protein